MNDSVQRPTKKQRELLNFIDGFIKGNGYGPSYREVMRALDYKSVSTVATHIDGLITRGYLLKKNHSARSLEIVAHSSAQAPLVNEALKNTAPPSPIATLFITKIALLEQQNTLESLEHKVILERAAKLLDINLMTTTTPK